MREEKKVIKKFLNYYCDGYPCALGEFLGILGCQEVQEKVASFTGEERNTLIEYAILKNIGAGVGEVNIKTQDIQGTLSLLDKYHLKGKAIISAKDYCTLTTNDLIGGRVILDIESLLDYNADLLSQISDFSARADIPLAINLSSDLEEIGKLVNLYSLSPAEVLESFGLLDRECFVYGLNYLDKDDQKLIKRYEKMCIFSPQSDGLQGKGAINLYNFIFNQLKFGFSSGKCYNIDMLLEGLLAEINTSNLMHEGGIVKAEEILKPLQSGEEKLAVDYESEEGLLCKKIELNREELAMLKEKTKEIARKIKENK